MSAEGLVRYKKRNTDNYIINDNLILCQIYHFQADGISKSKPYYRRQMEALVNDIVDLRMASEEVKKAYRCRAYDD